MELERAAVLKLHTLSLDVSRRMLSRERSKSKSFRPKPSTTTTTTTSSPTSPISPKTDWRKKVKSKGVDDIDDEDGVKQAEEIVYSRTKKDSSKRGKPRMRRTRSWNNVHRVRDDAFTYKRKHRSAHRREYSLQSAGNLSPVEQGRGNGGKRLVSDFVVSGGWNGANAEFVDEEDDSIVKVYQQAMGERHEVENGTALDTWTANDNIQGRNHFDSKDETENGTPFFHEKQWQSFQHFGRERTVERSNRSDQNMNSRTIRPRPWWTPILAGTLFKRGRMLKALLPRYFTLAGGVLASHKCKDAEPSWAMSLKEAEVEAQTGRLRFSIRGRRGGRNVLLFARTEEEVEVWVSTIQKTIDEMDNELTRKQGLRNPPVVNRSNIPELASRRHTRAADNIDHSSNGIDKYQKVKFDDGFDGTNIQDGLDFGDNDDEIRLQDSVRATAQNNNWTPGVSAARTTPERHNQSEIPSPQLLPDVEISSPSKAAKSSTSTRRRSTSRLAAIKSRASAAVASRRGSQPPFPPRRPDRPDPSTSPSTSLGVGDSREDESNANESPVSPSEIAEENHGSGTRMIIYRGDSTDSYSQDPGNISRKEKEKDDAGGDSIWNSFAELQRGLTGKSRFRGRRKFS